MAIFAADKLTLEYAEPHSEPTMTRRWLQTATAIWAILTLLERAAVWGILLNIVRSRGYQFDLTDVIDHFLPPLVALAILMELLRRHRSLSAKFPWSIVALCGLVIMLALASIAIWTWQFLPRVYSGRGGMSDAIVWEAELVLWKLLPIGWPLMVIAFTRRRMPSRRVAAIAFTIWSVVVLFFATAATAALVNNRGRRALSPDMWEYTVLPVWTTLLLMAALAGGMLVLRRTSSRSILIFVIAGGAWVAAGALKAWYDERLIGLTQRPQWDTLDVRDIPEIGAELLSTLALWQIAPFVPLLFATQVFSGASKRVVGSEGDSADLP